MNQFITAYHYGAEPSKVKEFLEELKCALHERFPTTFTGGINAQQDASAVVEVIYQALKIPGSVSQYLLVNETNNTPSTKTIDLNFLNLSITEVDTLDLALQKYFNEEVVDYKQEGQEESKPATKKNRIIRLPDILPITLARYDYKVTYPMKITKEIKTNGHIDLSAFVDEAFQGSAKYKVVGVVYHHGGFGGGHYTSSVFKNGKWYHCDDSTVSVIEKPNLETAYSYIFERVKPQEEATSPEGAI